MNLKGNQTNLYKFQFFPFKHVTAVHKVARKYFTIYAGGDGGDGNDGSDGECNDGCGDAHKGDTAVKPLEYQDE